MVAQPIQLVLIDDDAVDVRAIRRALRKQNMEYPLHVASDGVAALQLLRGTPERSPLKPPYLILLDLKLPRMDGFAFLAELRNDPLLCRTPVIVLTTSNHEADVEAAYAHHVAGYLVKPNTTHERDQQVAFLDLYVNTITFPPK